jgi:hypothetical protein
MTCSDDRVVAVGGLGVKHGLRVVGEDRVVAVDGEHLGLPPWRSRSRSLIESAPAIMLHAHRAAGVR